MSILARITNPKKPKNNYISIVSIILAAIFIIVSLGQLYLLDDFLNIVIGLNIPGGAGFATFLVCFVIVLEVFSLPFLLGMSLSIAMRFCSMVSSWLVMAIWLFLWCWAITCVKSLNTLGDWFISIWMLLPFTVVVALIALSSWGMWPDFADRKSN